MQFQQIKTGADGTITIIDDEVINLIKKIEATDSVELNNLIYDRHKYLLKKSKYKNNSWEVGVFFDLENTDRCYTIMGKINGIDMHKDERVMKLIKNNPVASVVVLHNHPRNGLFSEKDIQTFCDFNSIYLVTAVCNDGTIHMLRKEENFNPFAMKYYYNEGVERSKKEAYAEKLKKAKKLKLDPKNPEHRKQISKIKTKPYYYGIKNVLQHQHEIGITYRCSVKRKGGK